MALLTLPDDIFYDILKLLDWKSLFAIKLTCRRLRTISKSRILWILKSSELSLKSGSPVLEGPGEKYSVEELEQRVIKQLQIQERWRNPDPSAFRLQKLKIDYQSPEFNHLLPGGRWLLGNSIAGQVCILDLNQPEEEPELLFEERRHTDEGYVMDPLNCSAIWVDPSKSWLSLRIALHNDGSDEATLEPTRICIYQLDFNDRDDDPTWIVKPMVTLVSSFPYFKEGLQLEEDYLVGRSFYENGRTGAWKDHIFRYSSPGPRLVVWEYPEPATTILLPGNRLVAITKGSDPHAELFNIKIPTDSHSLTLEPSFSISLHSSPISSTPRVHVNHRFSYIITTCVGGFRALRIPHETGAPPMVKWFSWDDAQDEGRILGPSLMVILRGECLVDFITYDLRGDLEEIQVESHISRLRMGFGDSYLKPPSPTLVAYDEGSGRILIYHKGRSWLLQI